MAIVWYSEEQAETAFDETLTQWATMFAYKGCYSADHTRNEVEATKVWAHASPTAVALMRYVELSPQNIVVVGMKGGYQCFDSTAGASKIPVIFVDLDGKLTANIRTPHNIHFDPNLCSANVAPLHNRVALLHEFGHAKQWMERPSQFDNRKAASGTVQPKWGGAAQKSGGGQFDARLEKKTFATEIREKAMQARARRDKVEDNLLKVDKLPYRKQNIFQSTEEFEAFKAPVWGPAIEMDNMSRHEWTICNELGLPKRSNYRDINCTSDSEPSMTSMIRRKVEETVAKEKAAADAKKKEAERQITARTTPVTCPICTATFQSKLMLTRHTGAAHC